MLFIKALRWSLTDPSSRDDDDDNDGNVDGNDDDNDDIPARIGMSSAWVNKSLGLKSMPLSDNNDGDDDDDDGDDDDDDDDDSGDDDDDNLHM